MGSGRWIWWGRYEGELVIRRKRGSFIYMQTLLSSAVVSSYLPELVEGNGEREILRNGLAGLVAFVGDCKGRLINLGGNAPHVHIIRIIFVVGRVGDRLYYVTGSCVVNVSNEGT